jgi:hypothetical protein
MQRIAICVISIATIAVIMLHVSVTAQQTTQATTFQSIPPLPQPTRRAPAATLAVGTIQTTHSYYLPEVVR